MSQSRLERREKVSYLLIQGKSQTRIANEIGVSRKTIGRDVAFLKEKSEEWLEDLVRGNGFVFEAKITLDKLRSNEVRLRKLLEGDLKSLDEARIIKQIDENVISQLEILIEGPTLYGLKKGVQVMEENR